LTLYTYFKYELAELYGISKPTLNRWLEKKIGQEKLTEIGIGKYTKLFSIEQMEIIFKKLGKPCKS